MYEVNHNAIEHLTDIELMEIQRSVQQELSRLSILHTYLIEQRILRMDKNNGRKRTET